MLQRADCRGREATGAGGVAWRRLFASSKLKLEGPLAQELSNLAVHCHCSAEWFNINTLLLYWNCDTYELKYILILYIYEKGCDRLSVVLIKPLNIYLNHETNWLIVWSCSSFFLIGYPAPFSFLIGAPAPRVMSQPVTPGWDSGGRLLVTRWLQHAELCSVCSMQDSPHWTLQNLQLSRTPLPHYREY